MTASCFRTTIGRLVALGTILTIVTFQYIAVKSKSQLSFYELILQLSSCILLCNFLVVVARWAVYEPIQGLKDNDSLPYINVIIPAYNESEFVRNSISSVLSSDYPRDKVHIIVVDDGSTDDTWSHIQHELPPKYSAQHTTIRHKINRGERQVMVTAHEVAKSEILVTLDSDTILDRHTLRNLVSPFILDSDVGGVTGHLSVFNIQSQGWDSFIPRILDCLFEQNGNIPRAAQSKHGFITILPGAISAFRRDAILPHTKALVDKRFLGRPMRHGEDVQLTMGLLRDGWRLKYQSNAVGYTVAPETFLKAFLMYVRWERSNYTYWMLGLVPGTVAFTFDDDSWTEKDDILSLFAQRNAQASFFLRSTPWTTDVIKDDGGESGIQKLHENGHLIGLGTSSRRPRSDAEQQELLKARQKVYTVLGASPASDDLRPQYIWPSPSDCTVRNGCVEKLTINEYKQQILNEILSSFRYEGFGKRITTVSVIY
ncbi:nucleotide-diphospho-sugar transferase [Colletotrichum phormii]|uniref:Nucleotide-diphospho-sugar transferase n=1 Tax=Colletotrichum phormii TaxID=359342 RepID=A0AAI9ZUS8_9PEZI|nr:nucleotide-diphospho-sugar transferase [Colletotrichum phormii]KAK1638235.1 nucleotide-diphospho-sugar transferase [Colletotrichum phormii]